VIVEHPVDQPIEAVVIHRTVESVPDVITAATEEAYRVGQDGVTLIEPTTKSGMHANIPYIRVWRGEVAVGEWCQHNIIGVYFKAPT
jgi:hypothetical protein